MVTYDDVYIRPKHSGVKTRDNVNLTTEFTRNIQIGCPVVASPMDTVMSKQMGVALANEGCTGIMHRFDGVEEQAGYVVHMDENTPPHDPICVSVGVHTASVASNLADVGADVILIDVANGDHDLVREAIATVKSKNVDIIAGNVATFDGACRLIRWGVDAVRVGIGNGSVCSTRLKTGVGVPQVTAIREARDASEVESDGEVPVIADGGIRQPGDAAKALAAGADTVMVGSILAGTDETPGELKMRENGWPDRELYKEYRGSASQGVKGSEDYVEGVTRTVPYRGSVDRIIGDMKDGLRSSYSYVGAKTTKEFHANAELQEVSGSANEMGKPHH